MHSSQKISSRIAICVIILALGVAAALFFTRLIDREARTELLQDTQYAALLVTPRDVADLSATTADIGAPTYERLKQQFIQFRSFNDRIRFVYLMGYRPELKTQFFYLDSESPDSADYSPPGQLFGDTTQADIDGYLAGTPWTSGPYRDSWGEWVSGNVPIAGADGTTIAMVGIDIATSVWHRDMQFVWFTVGSITILLCVLMWVMLGRIATKQASIDTLANKNRTLERDEAKLREIQSLGQLGKVSFYFADKRVVVDESLATLFGNRTRTTMSFDEFLVFVHPDDEEKARAALDEIVGGTLKYSWFDVRVGSSTEGYRLYHFYGNVERDADGVKFSGIMQDITDIQK